MWFYTTALSVGMPPLSKKAKLNLVYGYSKIEWNNWTVSEVQHQLNTKRYDILTDSGCELIVTDKVAKSGEI